MADDTGRLKVRVRPATARDFVNAFGSPPPYRVRAWSMEREDGQVVCIGGLAFPRNMPGPLIFIDMLPEGEPYRLSLHRACTQILRRNPALTVCFALITIDQYSRRNEKWAHFHGFRDTGSIIDGKRLYVWKRESYVYPAAA